MNKILFIADIHIKEKAKDVPAEFIETRWQLFLSKLKELQNYADTVIIGGDVFDTALPTPVETRRFFELIQALRHTSYIIPGNHEQKTKKYNILEDYIASTKAINPLVSVVTEPMTLCRPDEGLTPLIDLLPYQYIDKPTNQAKVLVTHVRGEIPPHVEPEVDLDIYSEYDIVLAGDLHARSNSQGNIHYPGSPYTTSYHRSKSVSENGALLLDLATMDIRHIDMELPQLLKYTASSVEDIVESDYDHIHYELEGSIEEMASVKGENVTRKPRKRDSEARLSITGNDTEDLALYLSEVAGHKEEDVKRMMKRDSDKIA